MAILRKYGQPLRLMYSNVCYLRGEDRCVYFAPAAKCLLVRIDEVSEVSKEYSNLCSVAVLCDCAQIILFESFFV